SLTSVTTNSSSDTDVNANFGFGPPFLFSLPEPIDDQWKLKSELTLRDMGARPVSTHALRRILERRKLHNFFDNAQEKSRKRDMKERTGETDETSDDEQAVDVKVDEYSQEMLKSISECSKNYLENRCAPGDRVPALERFNTRAKISAEAFGEIINNLMEQFSYKTMLFMVGIVLAIFLSRALIELFKTRFLNNFPPQTPNTHPGIHSMPSSPTPITPMQVHSVSPIQHRMSPSTSIENPMASQHSNVGVYYVVTPTR
ncbi:39175_t:CDS:2, partial [Gigaspora margarita]